MRIKGKLLSWIAVGFLLFFAIYQLYPLMLFRVMEWQKEFNLALSGSLNKLNENQQYAGLTLVFMSFLYGIFHAVGPGHGKFVLTSYLSIEKTKLNQAMRITLTAAVVQGVIAVLLVSIIVGIFTLSRSYFNLTIKWVERGSFIIMILFGLYWGYQAIKPINKTKKFKITSLHFSQEMRKNLPLVQSGYHIHSEHCGCGHKHLPTASDMQKAVDWKAQWMLIFTIGARPCSGAVLVLFLSYTLELYFWGVISALVMAIGTGTTLSLFAYLVIIARNRAVQMSRWYFSANINQVLVLCLKCVLSLSVIILGVTLLHSSFIEVNSMGLFRR